MIDTLDKLLRAPQVHKYRRLLLVAAVALLMLHISAIVLPFLFEDRAWIQPLTDNSGNLLGVTGALLLLVVLDRAVLALSDADKGRRHEVYDFITKSLIEWFAEASSPRDKSFMERIIDAESHTDFKVEGHPDMIYGVDGEIAREFCRRVHFEFTFYPTKVIYGIHFESPSAAVNEVMYEHVRQELAIDDETGFVRDRAIPKKPSWIFLIRTVDAVGGLEKDQATIMTHARHFVELVGHSYEILYSDEMAASFAVASSAAGKD